MPQFSSCTDHDIGLRHDYLDAFATLSEAVQLLGPWAVETTTFGVQYVLPVSVQ